MPLLSAAAPVRLTLLVALGAGRAPAQTLPVGLRPARVPSSPARAAARASLLSADRAHAARSARSLLVGFPTALDHDVLVLYPGVPVARGRAAAESLLRALPAAPRRALRWRAALAELSGDGLRGYTLGYGSAVVGESDTPVRYLAYWRRTPAGAWHVAAWVLAVGRQGADGRNVGGRDAERRGASALRIAPPCDAPAAAVEPAPDRASTAARELRSVDSAFAARSARDGASSAFAAYLAPDGLVLGGATEMTCGPAAVGVLFGAVGPGALVWSPTAADAASSGDLGMTAGTASVRGEPGPGAAYVTVWRRGRDGAWRVAVDAGAATSH